MEEDKEKLQGHVAKRHRLSSLRNSTSEFSQKIVLFFFYFKLHLMCHVGYELDHCLSSKDF